jgi:phosphatidate cytidylyltransferase
MVASLALLAAAFAESAGPLKGKPVEQLIVLLFLLGGFCLVFRGRELKQGVLDLFVSLGGLFYLGWTLAFLVRVYSHGDGRQGTLLFFFLILVTKCGDIGGYALGLASARRPGGNHKMTPVLSPKKSWEGFVGSLLFSAVAGALIPLAAGGSLVSHQTVAVTPLSGAVLGLVLAAVGLIGDLAESALKRAAGVKDSGNTLPGMGGVLDVIDSLVFVGPLGYAYLVLLGA